MRLLDVLKPSLCVSKSHGEFAVEFVGFLGINDDETIELYPHIILGGQSHLVDREHDPGFSQSPFTKGLSHFHVGDNPTRTDPVRLVVTVQYK